MWEDYKLTNGSRWYWNSSETHRAFPQTDSYHHLQTFTFYFLIFSNVLRGTAFCPQLRRIYNWNSENKTLGTHVSNLHLLRSLIFSIVTLPFYIPKHFHMRLLWLMSPLTHTCSPHNIPQVHPSASYWVIFLLFLFFFCYSTFHTCEFHCYSQELKL